MTENISQLFKATLSLIAVLVLIGVLFFAIRYFTRRVGVFGAGRLKILDKAAVTQNTAVAVISVCGKLILVGSGTSEVRKLCDLDMTEEEYQLYGRAGVTDSENVGESETASAIDNKMSFADALKTVIAKKLGK